MKLRIPPRVAPLIVPIAATLFFAWASVGQTLDLRRLRMARGELRTESSAVTEYRDRAVAAAATVSGALALLLDARAARDSAADKPYIVVSIADNRLQLKQGDDVLFETRVATGSGKYLERGSENWKFETPRGRLVVVRKDVNPAWVPPDWHFVEAAQKRKLQAVYLQREVPILVSEGVEIAVSGENVVTRYADGREVPFEIKDGGEIRVGNLLIIPPFGTNQRRYPEVLGVARLYLGDGYAIHGTNNPKSIGQSVSHGCIRVRNEDIETLFRVVPLGTPVYVY